MRFDNIESVNFPRGPESVSVKLEEPGRFEYTSWSPAGLLNGPGRHNYNSALAHLCYVSAVRAVDLLLMFAQPVWYCRVQDAILRVSYSALA